MGTLRSSVQLFDGYSPIVRNMIQVNRNIIDSFRATDNASQSAFNVRAIEDARASLARVETDFDDVERQIKEADQQQQRFNNDIRSGSNASNGLLGTITKIAGAVGASLGVKKIFDISDQVTLTTARLNMMNDGLQTTEVLQEKIFQSAQRSRAEYSNTAAMVAKLGMQAKDAFSNNDELIVFSETLNKSFAIAGADAQAVDSVMYNLTQALSSGVLRGQDLNAVFSNAPNIIQRIADYLEVPVGQIRGMAADGELSASVVKNAMLSSVDDINAQFETMPKTIGQVWTNIKNNALKAFQPILKKINEIVNNPEFDRGVQNIINALFSIAGVALTVFEWVGKIASYIGENWEKVAPIVEGVTIALVAFKVAAWATTAATTAMKIAKYAYVGALSLFSTSAATAQAAQWGLNAAMYANPIGIVIALIVAAAAAWALFTEELMGVNVWFGALLDNIGKHLENVGRSIWSVIQNIGLWFANLGLAIWARIQNIGFTIANFFIGIWESVKAIASNIATAFGNAWVWIQIQFWTLVDNISQGLKSIAELANTYLGWMGINIDTSGLDIAKDKLAGLNGQYGDFQSIGDAWKKGTNTLEYVNEEDAWNTYKLDWVKDWVGGYTTNEAFKKGWGSDAYNKGADIGARFKKGILDLFNFLPGGEDEGSGNDDDPYGVKDLIDKIYKDTGDTAENTAKMANSMDGSAEELKYLREIAERQAINKFTTAEIKVEVAADVKVDKNDDDIDGFIDKVSVRLADSLVACAEGVHV